MTLTISDDTSQADCEPERRDSHGPRDVLNVALIAATVVMLMVVAAVVGIVADQRRADAHGPIDGPGFYRVAETRDIVHRGSSTQLAAGASARGVINLTIGNAGTRPTWVLSADTDDVVTKVEWAPMPKTDDRAVFDDATRWRPFPVLLDDEIVQLRITFRRPPECVDRRLSDAGGGYYQGALTLRWLAGLDVRTSAVAGLPDLSDAVQIC